MGIKEKAERILQNGEIDDLEFEANALDVSQAHLDLLQKLREPTEEMIKAGYSFMPTNYHHSTTMHVSNVFKAMIKVIEKE